MPPIFRSLPTSSHMCSELPTLSCGPARTSLVICLPLLLLVVCVHVCVCIYVCMDVCMLCAHVLGVDARGGQRSTSGIFHPSLRLHLSLKLGLTDSARWADQLTFGIVRCLPHLHPVLGLEMHATVPDAGSLSSGPQACPD